MEIILNNIKYHIHDSGLEAYVLANNYKGDIVIPPYIQHDGQLWIAVKGISYAAFRDCEELTSVSLPEGLSTIENRAFERCTQLKEIIIPDTVVCIQSNAFSKCKSLQKVKLPHMLMHIDYDMFWECESLQEIDIPSKVRTIESHSFYKCTQLKRISLPEGLQEIGRYCFAFCENLTEIRLPDSIQYLADSLFLHCIKLQHVTLPAELNYIPNSCFEACYELKDIDIPSSVCWIGEYAFHWTALHEAQGNQLQYLGCVLRGGRLSEEDQGVLRVKDGTRCIANRAFYENDELVEVILPASVETIGEEAFAHCKNLKRVQLADGLMKIGLHAFAHCSALEAIYIPSSVESIYSGAFSDCPSIKQMVVDANNLYYDSRQNCNGIVHTDLKMLVAACPSTVILDVLEIIGDSAFHGMYQSEELVLPQSVKCIGRSAFGGNTSLQRVVIPETMELIACYAFADCDALSEIILPKKYIEIGEDAFSGTACVNNQLPGAAYVGNHMCCYSPHTEHGPEPDCVIPEGIEYIDAGVFHFTPPMRIFFPKSLKEVDICGFIPDSYEYELIVPEGVGYNYPVKNGHINYSYNKNEYWWDALNIEWNEEE